MGGVCRAPPQRVEKVALPLFREKLMNVFLRKISFCYGKLPARPAKPVDTIAVLQTASYSAFLETFVDGLNRRVFLLFLR